MVPEYHLVILDVMMPHISGFTLAQEIRKIYPNIPILFLTAKDQKIDKLTGLKIGADDYVTKPCDPEELALRMINIINRSNSNHLNNKPIKIGGFIFDQNNLVLNHENVNIQLTEKEAELLLFLYQNKDRLISREEILLAVWNTNDFFIGRSMDVFITRLRKHFSSDPNISIQSIRGVGFKVKF